MLYLNKKHEQLSIIETCLANKIRCCQNNFLQIIRGYGPLRLQHESASPNVPCSMQALLRLWVPSPTSNEWIPGIQQGLSAARNGTGHLTGECSSS